MKIMESKKYLENLLEKRITGFSFPGSTRTKESVTILKSAGYQFAFSIYDKLIFRNSDLFNLPRIWVPDIKGDQFQQWLSKYLVLNK